MHEIIRLIKQIFAMPALKANKVRINRKANIDPDNCVFEGYNYVGDRTVLRDVVIGKGSYIADQSNIFSTRIGRFCSISSKVNIVFGQHPTRGFVSTHPAFYSSNNPSGLSYLKENLYEQISYADRESGTLVEIGNDVCIGFGALILNGVRIADGTIVAAGAVVTRSTEPYSIVGGVPAKLIRKRFSDIEIDRLLELKWWDKDDEWLKEHSKEFENIGSMVSI